MLKDQLIICFIRGNNYKNKSKIIFEEKIDLTEFIEPDINSPHYFYLVGTVIRSFKDKELDNNLSLEDIDIQLGLDQDKNIFYYSLKKKGKE